MIRIGFPVASLVLAAWLVAASWMRWMDPFIDFGREIYIPWRITCGEHLGRDFIHPYGPLSAYFNAGLFAVFGVSIRTLVIANLAIFAGILVCLFAVARRAFGFLPGAAATLVCIAVFGFEHYWGVNNYTYAAPYSHEATHGMLLLLLLMVWLGRPRFAAGTRDAIVTGLLAALGCLTKTEYVVAVAALWILATIGVARDRCARPLLTRWIVGTVIGFIAIFGLAWLLLVGAIGPALAAKSVANAILAPFTFRAYSTSTHVLHFLGADRPLENLRTIAHWSGWTAFVFGGFAFLAIAADRTKTNGAAVAGALAGAGLAVWVATRVDWVFCGSAFPLLLAGGGVWLLRQYSKDETVKWGWGALAPLRGVAVTLGTQPRGLRRRNQLLFFIAALALLARMAFDPTISHYGFFQAMLAATWLTGFLLVELPNLLGSVRAQVVGRVAIAALIAGGATVLVRRSLQFYAVKQTPMGTGADRIYGFEPRVYPLPEMWERVRHHLESSPTNSETLLVIPEGLVLNFWTRRKQPLAISDTLPATLELAEEEVFERLTASPPDVVVLVSRAMAEFGVRAYGEDPQTRRLMEWVSSHYVVTYREGEYPFSPPNLAVWVLRRKN